MLEVIICIF